MPGDAPRSTRSKMTILGWSFSVVGSLALLASAGMKLAGGPEISNSFAAFGYPPALLPTLGILEATLVAIYLIPATRVLGAILLASYLGGAVATHVRVGESFVPPMFLGIFLWVGIYLRDPRVRAVFPFAERCAKP